MIDKLSMTIDINSRAHSGVLQRLQAMELHEDVLRVTNADSNLLKSYRYAYLVNISPDQACTIQIAPKDRGDRRRFMRLEWNPHKSSRGGGNSFDRILHCLSECIPTFDPIAVITESSITRIDISFDLFRVPVDSLLAFTILRKPNSRRFAELQQDYGPRGYLNSVDLGRYDADRYLVIYDKNIERRKRGIGGIGLYKNGTTVGYRPIPRTRFELRLRDVGTYRDFLTLPNPYENYTITTFRSARAPSQDHHWVHFLDSCEVRGAQAALSLIENRRIRTQYRDALRACQPPDWWNPSLLWEEAKNAFRRILLPDTNPINGQTTA